METPSGNLSQIMRHINGAYTTYFNLKRNRAGHLFQGRYRAILIEADEYAKELSRYIHLNPVRAGLVGKAEDYPWCSYASYIGRREPEVWLRRDFVLGYFGKEKSEAQGRYKDFVEAALGQEYGDPLSESVASAILGSEGFVEEIKERYLKQRRVERDLPALKELVTRPSIEEIDRAVESVLGEDPVLSKRVKLYLCQRYSGERLKEIGDRFSIGESGVSQASRRIRGQIVKDKRIRKMLRDLEKALSLSKV